MKTMILFRLKVLITLLKIRYSTLSKFICGPTFVIKSNKSVQIIQTVKNGSNLQFLVTTVYRPATAFASLQKHCVRHRPFSEVHLIRTTFQELVSLPSSSDYHYTDTIFLLYC
jgi:hypothetical protein